MLIYVGICVSIITQVYNLNTDHSHNKFVRKTEYKVNISLAEDDIEMIGNDKPNQFNDTGIRFCKTWRKKPYRTPWAKNHAEQHAYEITTHSQYTISRPPQNLSHISIVSEASPNNNSLFNGNYGESTTEEKSNKTHDAVTVALGEESNTSRIARETAAKRICKIMQIWLVVYIVLAIPLWCSIGRCCCCLFCKCCKAQETIKEAKQYLMRNPPGVLRDKSGDVIYEASEQEKEAYEELEHLIRTL